MIGIRTKKIILGTVIAAAAASLGIFVWGETVDRHSGAVLADARRIQDFYQSGTAGKEIGNEQENIPPPNLDRPVVVTAALSPKAKKESIARIAELTARMKKGGEPGDWLELALYRKTIGDWDGAEEIWTYIAANDASDGISLANLANLYLYERKDPKKAETFLLAAIERAPHQVLYYETAYELYRFVLKNDAKGKEVVLKGLLANPDLADAFKDILARF